MLPIPNTAALADACQIRTRCRAGGGLLHDVLALGTFSLSDFFTPTELDSPGYPLTLAMGEQSGLVQLRHTVQPDLMFRHYWYHSGTNEAMRSHLERLVEDIGQRVQFRQHDLVLDIGCNDGTLLRAYPKDVIRAGCDPSDIEPEGIDLFVNGFFSADPFAGLKARVITTIAMFYDLDDPVQFAQEVADLLTEDGLWVIEMHYLPVMLATNGFDAICHEHLCYYSLRSLEYVLHQAGLVVVDVTQNGVNGGSFRAYVRKFGHPSPAVTAMRAAEAHLDFVSFIEAIAQNKQRTRETLHRLKTAGQRILGYGASTKGNTLLQYYGITPDLLPAIADRNPNKWGLVTAGSRIPVISEAEARALCPNYFFVLPYHFIDAFIARENTFLSGGGRFLVPLPALHAIPGGSHDL